MKVFAKYSAVFYGKSQAQAGCQLNQSLYIYINIYICIFIEQLEVGAGVYRKVLTSLTSTDTTSSYFLSNSRRLQTPNPWAGPPLECQRKKSGLGCTSAKLQLSIPWGKASGSHTGAGPCQNLVSEAVFQETGGTKMESTQLLQKDLVKKVGQKAKFFNKSSDPQPSLKLPRGHHLPQA